MVVPWLTFRDAIYKFQLSLGRCCGGSVGSLPTNVSVGLGRWNFVVPISADSPAVQAPSQNSDGRHPPEFFTKKPGVRDGQILKLHGENYCACGQNFHVARGARAFSRVSCTEHYSRNKVWVKKGTSLGGSMGINIQSPAFSNYRSGINLCVSGANICSPSEPFPDNIDGDKSDGPRPLSSIIFSPCKAEDIVKSEVASVCNNCGRDLVDLEMNGEEVVGFDVVGDACSPSAMALIPKSGRMLLKKLRARKRFWSRNRAEFFRAQRRVGSIRMKNLIFGV